MSEGAPRHQFYISTYSLGYSPKIYSLQPKTFRDISWCGGKVGGGVLGPKVPWIAIFPKLTLGIETDVNVLSLKHFHLICSFHHQMELKTHFFAFSEGCWESVLSAEANSFLVDNFLWYGAKTECLLMTGLCSFLAPQKVQQREGACCNLVALTSRYRLWFMAGVAPAFPSMRTMAGSFPYHVWLRAGWWAFIVSPPTLPRWLESLPSGDLAACLVIDPQTWSLLPQASSHPRVLSWFNSMNGVQNPVASAL